MTNLKYFVLFDSVSERIIGSFFGSNERYAKKQVEKFVQNQQGNVDVNDLRLFDVGDFDVPDNLNDILKEFDYEEISLVN